MSGLIEDQAHQQNLILTESTSPVPVISPIYPCSVANYYRFHRHRHLLLQYCSNFSQFFHINTILLLMVIMSVATLHSFFSTMLSVYDAKPTNLCKAQARTQGQLSVEIPDIWAINIHDRLLIYDLQKVLRYPSWQSWIHGILMQKSSMHVSTTSFSIRRKMENGKWKLEIAIYFPWHISNGRRRRGQRKNKQRKKTRKTQTNKRETKWSHISLLSQWAWWKLVENSKNEIITEAGK